MIALRSSHALLALGLPAALAWSSVGQTQQVSATHQGHSLPPTTTTQSLKATLVGTTEVPGPGDPDGTGAATVAIDVAKNQLCYTIKVAQVDGVIMAHIHRAPMGSMGNVVLPLSAPTTGSSEGCVQVKPELAAAILAAPTDYYVNVHSQAYQAGAVRGQLGR